MPESTEEMNLELRELLHEKKRQLWQELRDDIFRDTGEDIHEQYDIPQDPGDRSLLDLISDAGLAVADIRREELTRLEEAQRRLEMGRYGICESCGGPIGTKRLHLVPFTPYCVECQKQQEGPSKPPGKTM